MDERRDDEVFAESVGEKAERIKEARRHGDGVWFWLGMTGLVGWSVAVPTLLGVMAGRWLDRRHPASYSWTLSMFALGLAIGCVNAWIWVRRGSTDD